MEIEYILDTPFSMLSRKDVIIRKLLTKYHDDRDALQKAISAVAYSFDPHLAERTRGKNPKSYTQEEQRWSTVDRILHPEVTATLFLYIFIIFVPTFLCTPQCSPLLFMGVPRKSNYNLC